MSGRLMERVADLIASGAALGCGEKLVFFALARYADDGGTNCFPSLETIATVAGMTKRSVIRCVEHLAASGMVTVQQGGGRGRVNRYELHIEQVPPPGKTGAQRPPSRHVNGDTTSPFIPNPVDKSVDKSVGKIVNGDSVSPFAPVDKSLNGDSVSIKGDTESPDSIKTLRKKEKGDAHIDGKEGRKQAAPASPVAPPDQPELLADQAEVQAAVGSYLGNMRCSIAPAPGCRPQRTRAEQLEALASDDGPPQHFRPGPVEPVRSVEEQLAILLGTARPSPMAHREELLEAFA